MKRSQPKSSTSATQSSVPGVGHNSDAVVKLQLYVSKYNGFRKEEGELYVQRCALVMEAEKELSPKLFEEFLAHVHLPRKSSNFRKARAVAKAATRLLGISDRLPDSKSTIYELAQLDETTFSSLVEDEVITPTVTAEHIRMKSVADGEGKVEKCVAHIDATPLGHGERLVLMKELKRLASEMGATLRAPKFLEKREKRA